MATKTQRLELRASDEQRNVVESAAELTGTTLTDFVVGAAVDRARAVLAEQRVIQVVTDDARAFAAALDDETVVDELVELLSRGRDAPELGEPE